MKLSQYAKQQGISYSTALRWWHQGAIRGYQVVKPVKEVGSGVNESRPKLLSLLRDPLITRVVVEHQDRLTRFGFRFIETLLEILERTIEVAGPAENHNEDLLHDVARIVYSICARLYGQRRAKRKAGRLVEQLEAKDGQA